MILRRCLGRLRNFPQAHSQDSEDLGSAQDNRDQSLSSLLLCCLLLGRCLPSVLQSPQQSRAVLTMFSSWLPSSSSLPSRSSSFSLISCEKDRKCTVRLGGWCKGQRASFLRAEPGDCTVTVWAVAVCTKAIALPGGRLRAAPSQAHLLAYKRFSCSKRSLGEGGGGLCLAVWNAFSNGEAKGAGTLRFARVLGSVLGPLSHCVAQVGLKFTILLSQPSWCC